MPLPLTFTHRVLILLATAVAAAVGLYVFVPGPLAQDLHFHNFADQRTILGVPHFLNVISNLPFLLIGVAGLRFLFSPAAGRSGGSVDDPTLWAAYATLFVGVGLTAFGSAYYHLDPNNGRLVWDRLPMSIAFTGLLAAVIAERIDVRAGKALLMPLVAAGVWSVLYWHETEQRGHGDLRPYYYIQFFCVLTAIPLMVLLFPARYTRTSGLWWALGWYVLAKFLENPLDKPIFHGSHLVSGHTLKHLAAAMGAYELLRMVRGRERIAKNPLAA